MLWRCPADPGDDELQSQRISHRTLDGQNAVIFFSDLAGFSFISARFTPEQWERRQLFPVDAC